MLPWAGSWAGQLPYSKHSEEVDRDLKEAAHSRLPQMTAAAGDKNS